MLSEWARSDDGLKLSRSLIEDLWHPQSVEQLALTLNALLCYGRLAPHKPTDTTHPINGCYLADLDAIINGKSLSNHRTVFEKVESSLLRVLDTLGEHEHVIGLLTVGDRSMPLVGGFDGFMDQYLASRARHRLSHTSAIQSVGVLPLMKVLL